VYKKAVILLGKERYSVFMTSGEDHVMNFMIFQTANSFKYIPKYSVLRINTNNSADKIRTKEEKLISKFYYLNAVYDFSKNTLKGKEIVFCITFNLMNRKLFKKIIQKKKYKLFFNNILIKIFNSKFMRRRDKILIKKKYNNYKEFDINII
jgi:hypothetical protein